MICLWCFRFFEFFYEFINLFPFIFQRKTKRIYFFFYLFLRETCQAGGYSAENFHRTMTARKFPFLCVHKIVSVVTETFPIYPIRYTIIHQLRMCYSNFVYVCGSSCLLHTKFSKKNLKNVKCFCLCADFMCFWLCTICLCSCIWIYYCFGCRLCNSRYSHMCIYVCIGCAKTYYKAAKKYGSSIVVCCDGKCIELCASHRIHGNGWLVKFVDIY